ncbi:MAG TPA: TonB-dependent receptor [Cyclobacteriaceae bacterium]
MRVTLSQVVAMLVLTGISRAEVSFAQDALGRSVTLNVSNQSLVTALKEIEEVASVRFVYSKNFVPLDRKVTINVHNQKLSTVLTKLLHPLYINYEAVNDRIVLKKLKAPPAPADDDLQSNADTEVYYEPADFAVSGRVTSDTGDPLPGVNVLVKGTSNGTVTDVDGMFSLNVRDGTEILVFSFIGYVTQEVAINGQSTINVVLLPDVQSLEEVVVVGYGEKSKATVTGSVTSVRGDVITQTPVTNVSNALAGRLPGVLFINRSGEPGYDGSQIRVRGTNTIGNPSALIVIDGIANRSGGLERLNPADIESITVLKDASAAIYGAQAANGVILVTTKRGAVGKPEINVNYNLGFNTPTRLPRVADAATYATMLNEIDEYRERDPRYSAEEIQKFRDGSDPWRYPNTDWYDAVIKDVSMQDNLNLSVSGGTADGVRYFVSLGKIMEDGFYKNSATKYNQYSFRSNIDAQITNFFKVSLDVAGRQENRNFPTVGADQIFRMLIRGKPNLPAYWPNGLPGPDIENGVNPAVVSTNATGYVRDDNYVFQSNLRGTIDVPWVDGLQVILNAAFDEGFRPVKRFRTPWYLYTWDYSTVDSNGDPVLVKGARGSSTPELTESMQRTSGRTTNAYVNYNRNFGVHGVGFMVGVERQQLRGNHFEAFRNAFISPSVAQLFAGTRNESTNASNNQNEIYETARLNYFGRINYSYAEKYLLEMVWRYDASYIFPEDSRWGFFPGFSAGWVLSEEPFMAGVSFVDRLKLRGSWGQLGNDRISANPRDDEFQFISAFDFGGGYIFNYNTLVTTITPTSVANPNITWEVANNTNIGLEGVLFDGRISFEMDYFNNIRSKMLIPRTGSVPYTAGFDPPDENLGKLRNRGFDFMVNYHGEAGDVSYSIGLNGGYAKNKILFWDEAPGFDPWQVSTGRPVGSNLFYNAIGVFKDQAAVDAYPHWPGARPGDIIFEDVNDDGVIDSRDRVRQEYNNIPRFQGGLSLNANYKGFDLAILFQGASGAKQYIRTQSGDFGNFLLDFAEGRWTPENPNSEKPRTFNREDEYWISQANTYWYRSTDYVRLKNVQLGYTFPQELVNKVSLKSARIYVNAVNLITWDQFDVFDPETDNQDGTVYPQKRVYNVGVSLTF